MKPILKRLGYFLFELGVSIFARTVFGKEVRDGLDKLVNELASEELTTKQKYNRAKKFMDESTKQLEADIPDIAKNMVIEAAVAKIKDQKKRLLSR